MSCLPVQSWCYILRAWPSHERDGVSAGAIVEFLTNHLVALSG